MSHYASQLAIFHRAIVHEEHAAMLPLIKRARDNIFPAGKRLQVYLDAYEIRLEQATAMDYPALKHYVGDELFDEAIHDFVRATPSHTWNLNEYPLQFADFFCAHHHDALAQSLVRLETAITEVFWKPDSEALDVAALAECGMDALAVRVFRPRAALQLLALPREANAYLTAFRNDEPTEAIAEASEYLCLVRHPRHVQRLALDAEEYAILRALFAGKAFGAALDAVVAGSATPPEHLAAALSGYLQRWLSCGIFAA